MTYNPSHSYLEILNSLMLVIVSFIFSERIFSLMSGSETVVSQMQNLTFFTRINLYESYIAVCYVLEPGQPLKIESYNHRS